MPTDAIMLPTSIRTVLISGLMFPWTLGCSGGEPEILDLGGGSIHNPEVATSQASSELIPSASIGGPRGTRADDDGVLVDADIDPWQRRLLELAFEGVSGMPDIPHLRNRCRAQASIISTCMDLGLLAMADGFTRRVDNWRRGLGFADLAACLARSGEETTARRFLGEAATVLDGMDIESVDAGDMGWKRDRLRARMAVAHFLLGEFERAEQLQSGVVDSESGRVAAVASESLEPEAFGAALARLDATMGAGSFDQVRNAMHAAASLYVRFFGDPDRRSRVEAAIKSHWGDVPTSVRVEVLIPMAEGALECGDLAEARSLVRDAWVELTRARLTPDMHLPLAARLASLQHAAGEVAEAEAELEVALELYDAERPKIIGIYRAETLRPLAEAYLSIGERDRALELYGRVLEEGAENPNGRPVSIDLAETCCSMAVHGIEPTPALMERVLEIHRGLGAPW